VTAPRVLVIDDGELDRVQAVLERMPIDWLRCAEPDSGLVLERPSDLIISSGPRAMRMPPFAGEGHPLWVCVYDQDFLPLRERLRDLGVHYLVSGELAPHAFELFLRQLLNRGEERRSVRRIPLHCDVQVALGRERSTARLLELSRESCLLSMRRALASGQRIVIRLPSEHVTSSEELEVTGSVIRARGGHAPITAVIGFDTSDPRAIAHVQDLLSGNVLGTLVTPLHAEPGTACSTPAAESWLSYGGFDDVRPDQGERRAADRQKYENRVDAIRWQGESEPQALLAKDLSLSGLCVISPSPLPLRSHIGLALYGRVREEPLFVRAEVVRRDGAEVGLRFLALSPGQMSALERLLDASPPVEDLAVSVRARHVVEISA
jgi:hypothetical protein